MIRKIKSNKFSAAHKQACDGWAVVGDDDTIYEVCWYKRIAFQKLKEWRIGRPAKAGRVQACIITLC